MDADCIIKDNNGSILVSLYPAEYEALFCCQKFRYGTISFKPCRM